MEITKEQITEVLNCFKDSCQWMYFSKDAKQIMDSRIVQHKGEKFVITVRDDGYYGIKMPQQKIEIIVDARYVTHQPSSGSIENTEFKCKILNNDVIPKEIRETVTEAIKAFVSSAFTRTIAFCLFARLQPESIELISNGLFESMKKPDDKEDKRNNETCPGCKNEIDPDVCHCGTDRKNHGYSDNHAFVPMGCTCGYPKEDTGNPF